MYTNFLKSRTCYDIMPRSSKIVVFDVKLKVGKLLDLHQVHNVHVHQQSMGLGA